MLTNLKYFKKGFESDGNNDNFQKRFAQNC